MSILSIMLLNDFLTISFLFSSFFFWCFRWLFYRLKLLHFYAILLYSSFVILYIFDVLSAGVRVLLRCWINFISHFNVLCSWLCTVRNLIFFTNSIKSFSKAANSLTGVGVCWLFKPICFCFNASFHVTIYNFPTHSFNNHFNLLSQF